MTYNKKIKEILKSKEISQEKLANLLGVTFATLNRWVNDVSIPSEKSKEKIDYLYNNLFNVMDANISLSSQEIINRCKSLNIDKLIEREDVRNNIHIKMAYSSNRLEGSTMTEAEVSETLFSDKTFSHRTLTEHIEAKNHQSALHIVFANYKNKINQDYILELHKIMMNNILENAGVYRNHNVRIVGSFVPTTNYLSIEKRIGEWVNDYKKNHGDNIIEYLAKSHSQFEMIHPFSDGNGRVGRLLLIHLALQNNILPPIILPEYRVKYLNGLSNSQLDNNYDKLISVLIEGIRETMKLV